MRTTKLLTFVALFASTQLFAQAPVVGVADPESLFQDDNPQLHANKQIVLHVMKELLECNQWDIADQWLSERYIQHNPMVASGLAPVVEFFTAFATPNMDCDILTTPVVAVLADDDYVTVVMPREYPHPTNAGETYSTTWFDMWKIVDGKADEHWDPATLTAPPGN